MWDSVRLGLGLDVEVWVVWCLWWDIKWFGLFFCVFLNVLSRFEFRIGVRVKFLVLVGKWMFVRGYWSVG